MRRRTYIKRLVGLPGETIRIQHGDIWIRSAEDSAKATPVPHRPQAAGKTPGHAPAGVRQRLHAADRQVRLARPLAAGTDRPTAARPARGRSDDYATFSDRRHGRRRELAALPPPGAVVSAVAGRRRSTAASRRRTCAAVDHRLHGLRHGPEPGEAGNPAPDAEALGAALGRRSGDGLHGGRGKRQAAS